MRANGGLSRQPGAQQLEHRPWRVLRGEMADAGQQIELGAGDASGQIAGDRHVAVRAGVASDNRGGAAHPGKSGVQIGAWAYIVEQWLTLVFLVIKQTQTVDFMNTAFEHDVGLQTRSHRSIPLPPGSGN